MFTSPTIQQVEAGKPWLFHFRVTGPVTSEDMTGMSQVMNAAFDNAQKVDMLLSFQTEAGSEPGAGLNWETIRAQFRSLSNVRYYVTAAAPEGAASMVETLGALMPVETKTYDTEAEALAFLQAQPVPGA